MASKHYPIVEVTWQDAEEKGDVGWNDIKDIIKYAKKPCPTMKSVGYEVFRGTDHISLLSTVGLDECSTLEKIPLGFIIKIVYLTEIPTKEPNDADV
tara:strand:+ start:176 stop:466 length:291 start_codon:yes stop_codon:yes gene_type:complete